VISRLERILLNLSTFLTAATGLVYAWMKYLVRPADPYSVVNHPWQPGFLSGHVLVAPLLLFGLGMIAREHILGRYRDPRSRGGRRTGILTTLALVPMVSSGYLLQVVTSARSRNIAGILHLAAGLLFLAAYGLHLALAERFSRSHPTQKERIRGARGREKGPGKHDGGTRSPARSAQEAALSGIKRPHHDGRWRGAGSSSAGS